MKKLLEEMKTYIERVEVQIEGEWGACRRLEEILKDQDMPSVYYKIVNELDKLH